MNSHPLFPQRGNPFRLNHYLVLLLLLVFVATGCSHRQPFIAPGQPGDAPTRLPLDQIKQRVLLIGDAGLPQPNEPVLQKLQEWASQTPEHTTVVFLGDNIYPYGLTPEGDPEHSRLAKRLQAQSNVVLNSGARGIFVPGNHDWGRGGEKGLQRLLAQERFLSQQGAAVQLLPQPGCSGPVSVDLNGLNLIIIDSYTRIKQGLLPERDCPGSDSASFSEQLDQLITPANASSTLVLAHHGPASHGPHGGFFSWRDHLFPLRELSPHLWIPLPLIGSLYPLFRGHIINNDADLRGQRYRAYLEELKEAVKQEKPLLIAAGHDHNLQVLTNHPFAEYILVSGAGAVKKLNEVGSGDDTLFAHAGTGFMAVDLLTNGRILLRVVEPSTKEVVYARWLR